MFKWENILIVYLGWKQNRHMDNSFIALYTYNNKTMNTQTFWRWDNDVAEAYRDRTRDPLILRIPGKLE